MKVVGNPLILPVRTEPHDHVPLPKSVACMPGVTREGRWKQFEANRAAAQTSVDFAKQPSVTVASMASARALLACRNEAIDLAHAPESIDVNMAAQGMWDYFKGTGELSGVLEGSTPAMLREMNLLSWQDKGMGLRKLIKRELSGPKQREALLNLDRMYASFVEKFLDVNQLARDGEPALNECELVTRYEPTTNNKLTPLIDGENAFPQMLSAIDQAKETVNVEFFIIENDRLGNQLCDTLIAAAKRGCEVRLSIDAIGSHLQSAGQRAMVKRLEDGGVIVNKNWVLDPTRKHELANHPSHRKIVICDGKVGFTGGMNVAERYVDEYHDIFVRADGDVVKQMQSEFLLQWVHTHGPIDEDGAEIVRKFFPKVTEQVGTTKVKVAQAVPGESKEIMQTYLDRINGARKRVLIENPYLTEPTVREAAIAAAKRGVEVRVIVPGRNDQWYSAMAMRTHYAAMIDAGIQVYEYPGFNHGKTMVVDDEFVTIGTSNLDDVGLRHIYEINLNVEDPDFAYQISSQVFAVDIPKARLMTKEDVSGVQHYGGKILSAGHGFM